MPNPSFLKTIVRKYRPHILFLVKVLVFLICAVAAYVKLNDHDFISQWKAFRMESLHADILLCVLAILLMPLNWLLEALKWQRLTASYEKLSILKSLSAVFNGVFASVFLNIFLPGRSGDFTGRIIHLRKDHRLTGIGSSLVGSLAQNSVTLMAAFAGMCWLSVKGRWLFDGYFSHYLLLFFAALSTLICLLLYFNYKALFGVLMRIRFLRKRRFAFRALMKYGNADLFRIWIISFARYLVFFFQFYLLLRAFHIDPGFMDTFAIISMIFLLQSVVPSNIFTDLGIRASSAIYFFEYYIHNTFTAMAPSYLLWIINVLVPAIIGYIVFSVSRFNRK